MFNTGSPRAKINSNRWGLAFYILYLFFYLFSGVKLAKVREAARPVSRAVLLAKKRNAKTSTWQNTVLVSHISSFS